MNIYKNENIHILFDLFRNNIFTAITPTQKKIRAYAVNIGGNGFIFQDL